MRVLKLTVIVMLLVLATESIYAQNNNYDHCKQVFISGIRNTYSTTASHEYKKYIKIYISYSFDEIKNIRENNAASIGIPIPLLDGFIEAEGNYESNYNYFRKLRKRYVQSNEMYISESDFYSSYAQVLDSDAIAAWRECIRLTIKEKHFDTSVRFPYEIKGEDGNEINITFRYRQTSGTDLGYVTIKEIIVNGPAIKQINNNLNDGASINELSPYTLRLIRTDPTRKIEVTILFVDELEQINIVIDPLKVEDDVTTIGTIVTSVLPWELFKVKKNNNKWAPCDGRQIDGSDLAKYFGNKSPDLREMFLRGMNSYSTNSTGRKVGIQIEKDKVGAHSHKESYYTRHHETRVQGGSTISGIFQGPNDYGVVATTENPTGETRPVNIAVYYYIKINE